METKFKKVIFENGRVFHGKGFGSDNEKVCEVVFNTSMVGYQEILSDSSNCDQIICMTYPLIGNYGLTDEDYESKMPAVGGFIVREYNDNPSNYRYTRTLADVMAEDGVAGIEITDTREITRMLRNEGTMRAIIVDENKDEKAALEQLKNTPVNHNQVEEVSCKKLWYSRTTNYKYNIIAIDCGIKRSMVNQLNAKNCNVIVVPYSVSAEEVMDLRPDGLFISNGPGSPEDVPCVVELVKALKGKIPMFGVGLGHEIIALAYGAKVSKMKFGHRGVNHPVKNLADGTIEIVSYNHSYVVDKDSVNGTGLEITQENVLDGTVAGLKCEKDKVFSVQHHPEIAPGPKSNHPLYDTFVKNVEDFKNERGDLNA